MAKKILCFSIIILINIFLLNVSYATDISMDLENTSSSSVQTTDDTTYTSDTNIDTDTDTDADITTTYETTYNDYKPVATTTDYDESTDLSISNIINIILIVVGVVLILLGIAIIIKLN